MTRYRLLELSGATLHSSDSLTLWDCVHSEQATLPHHMLDVHSFNACRPFLLQAKASYTQIGVFSIALYPYSFKLLWSPVVDSLYAAAFGRRKSWVVGQCSLKKLARAQSGIMLLQLLQQWPPLHMGRLGSCRPSNDEISQQEDRLSNQVAGCH